MTPGDSPSRGAWRAALLLTLGYTAYYFCRTNFSVGRPLQIAEMGADGAVLLGRIATLGVVVGICGKFLAGRVVERVGGRGAFLLGALGAVLATLGLALGHGLGALALFWSLNRLFQALGWPATVRIIGGWFPARLHGRVLGLASLSWLFGDALSRAGQAQLLLFGWGWRPLFLASAGGLALVGVLCLLFLRESPASPSPDSAPQTPVTGEPEGEIPPSPGFGVPRAFFSVAAGALALTLVNVTLSEWLPLYFTRAGLTPGAAALASALFPAAGGVSAVTFGQLSDRTDARGRRKLLVFGLLLTALTLLGFLTKASPLLLTGLAGLATGGPYAWAVGAAALDLGSKERAATLNGYLDGTGYLGALLAGEAIARLAVRLGWSGAFATLAGVCVLCAGVAALLSRDKIAPCPES